MSRVFQWFQWQLIPKLPIFVKHSLFSHLCTDHGFFTTTHSFMPTLNRRTNRTKHILNLIFQSFNVFTASQLLWGITTNGSTIDFHLTWCIWMDVRFSFSSRTMFVLIFDSLRKLSWRWVDPIEIIVMKAWFGDCCHQLLHHKEEKFKSHHLELILL